MDFIKRSAIALAIAIAPATAPALAQAPTTSPSPVKFSHQTVTQDAERLAIAIRKMAETDTARKALATPGVNWRDTGMQYLAAGKNMRGAISALSLALTTNSDDWTSWLALARAYLRAVPDPSQPAERYQMPASASGAAWLAYTKAAGDTDKAEALAVLADALGRRSMWRPAIEALKTSIALHRTRDAEVHLARLRAEHGFRIADYKVDSDSASPRLCINFSERLARLSSSELGKFFTLGGREPESLSEEGNQLCIDGLKHGDRYSITVRAGLKAGSGETLQKSADISVYVRDRKPSVRLQGRAYVLPSRGQQDIPVTTVNASALAIELYRVADRSLALAAGSDGFLKNLDRWDLEQVRSKSAQKVWNGTLEVANRLNEDVTTAIPVSDVLKTPEPGIYIVSAELKAKTGGSDQLKRTAQWFVVSDMGLTAFTGANGLDAFVRSLASTTAVAGTRVRLIAHNNEVLGTATSDQNGRVHFDKGLISGEGSLAPRLLVADAKADYALLDLATAAFDLSDRGVKGRPAPGPLDAYLYAERGVYRPGETAHLAGLVRTANGIASAIPATLIVVRPDGVEHMRKVLPDQGFGGRTFDLAISKSAMTGTWRARLYSDPKAQPLAQTSFLVEDFVPERLAMTLTPKEKSLTPTANGQIDISGRYLYGPPAANLALEGEVLVRAAEHGVPGLPGYHFGIAGETFPQVRKGLEQLGSTSAAGKARIAVPLPNYKPTATPLEASVVIRLRETGGRAITRRITMPVDATTARIGIKPLFKEAGLGEGDETAFDVIVIDPANHQTGRQQLKWEIVRLDQRWQWYAHDGAWRYEPVTTTRKMANGTVTPTNGQPARITYKPEWGRYRLEVSTASGERSTVMFRPGWTSADNIDSPELLDVALDKSTYLAGETARLRITSREAGRALVTVLTDGVGVATTRDVYVPAGGREVEIPVDSTWKPGAYVAATLYRALDSRTRRMPSRAVGIAWLALDPKPDTLGLNLDLPERIRPGRSLTVPVAIQGLKAGEEARLTLAAVDSGILALTRYTPPDPGKWFHSQRRLGVEMRDLYGRLIDGMRAESGRLRSGGDGDGGMNADASPPVEKPLALFSGLVKVGADGKASVTFDMPDFNGEVRFMAVAWSRDKVGSASRDVVVRDHVALTATAPRFLTLGDTAQLALDVHNVDGPDAAYTIAVTATGADGIAQPVDRHDVTLKATQHAREVVSLQPKAMGTVTYAVAVSGPDGIAVHRSLELQIRPPAIGLRRTTVSSLAPGAKLSVSKDLFHDLLPGNARMTLTVGPTAAFDVAGLVSQLDTYPYGCAEQTTSRALPMLYLSGLAQNLGIAKADGIRKRVEEAIQRLAQMQDANGAFGIWGPSEPDLWLTAYVSDFLTRAKEQGYTVQPRLLDQALDRLSNYLAYAQDFTRGGEDRAYALYVLARNAKAPIGDLRYYVDARLDRFATPLAKAQLGAALAMLGDRARAGRAFNAALGDLNREQTATGVSMRDDYGSRVRDGAAVLTLAAETHMLEPQQAELSQVLAKAFRSRQNTSTQEQAWMLLAARAIAEDAKTTRLDVSGKEHTGELTRLLLPADLGNGDLAVTNRGSKAVDAVISVTGASMTPEPAVSRGFAIERSYYTLSGEKVDLSAGAPTPATITQNTRLVAVVTVKSEHPGGRILVVDRLPAGFEVENPALVDGNSLKGLAWLKQGRTPQHTEFRDDRVVAAFSFFGARSPAGVKGEPVTASVAYIVRAVTPGRYVHPAATVEDMYAPDRFARTDAGRVTVTA
ncbi:MAG: MG2 domain-containing protein, partial [Hyphomicrobiaceae bacterium]